MLENYHAVYGVNKQGGVYGCLKRIKTYRKDKWLSFKWEDVKAEPVGYKGNFDVKMRCYHCNEYFKIPEELIPRKILRRLYIDSSDS